MNVEGSSPLTRGKPTSAAERGTLPGAHPRSRGENTARSTHTGPPQGSSPLTRGKRGQTLQIPKSGGLIPAHAGKTTAGRCRRGRQRAHPRSRGENASLAASCALTAGSSPLTRGKHARGPRAATDTGLIPAHAGKTTPDRHSPSASWAHPRSRGENTAPKRPSAASVGSSPLTRGKLRRTRSSRRRRRLIPAHAGKTSVSRRSAASPWAHPRSRGENLHACIPTDYQPGSSSLTRGKLWRLPCGLPGCGLIPAHAGKTLRAPRR